jgi:uncharacterized protein
MGGGRGYRTVKGSMVPRNVCTICIYLSELRMARSQKRIAKHGIDFEDAIRVFDGPVLENVDTRGSYGERRIIAFGVVDDREIAVVYTMRREFRRIISARRAHRSERKAYREAYPKS